MEKQQDAAASGGTSNSARQPEETAVAPTVDSPQEETDMRTEGPDEEGPEAKRRREGTLVQSFRTKGSVATELATQDVAMNAEPQVGGTTVEEAQEGLLYRGSFTSMGE